LRRRPLNALFMRRGRSIRLPLRCREISARMQPSTLELVRLAAAMQELKDAREAFDILVSEKQSNKNRVSSIENAALNGSAERPRIADWLKRCA
jgi:hypothetical protein